MALNFPSPATDGLTWTDPTGRQWVYDLGNNSWTAKSGASGGMVYKGGINITTAPPAGVQSGWLYVVTTGGAVSAGFPGLTGTIPAGSQVVFGNPNWQLLSQPGFWSRNGAEVAPANAGDSVFTSGAVKVGGTSAAPNAQIKIDGTITSKHVEVEGAAVKAALFHITGDTNPAGDGRVATFASGGPGDPASTKGGFIDVGGSSAGNLVLGVDGNFPGVARLRTDFPSPKNLLSFNIGAGTTSFYGTNGTTPTIELHNDGGFSVNTSDLVYDAAQKRLTHGVASSSAQVSMLLQGSSGGGATGIVRVCRKGTPGSNGAVLGAFDFADNGHVASCRLVAKRDGGSWASGSNQPTSFAIQTTPEGSATPVDRVTVSSDGTMLINRASRAFLGGTVHFGVEETNGGKWAMGINAGGPAIVFNQAGNTSSSVGAVAVTASGTTYGTTSDYRLKENVVPLTGAIARFKQLQVHRFNFIIEPGRTVDGFIAHEAQAVVPECVTGAKDEVDADGNPVYQNIDQSKLVPLLTAALQEALAEIESLKARVAALEP